MSQNLRNWRCWSRNLWVNRWSSRWVRLELLLLLLLLLWCSWLIGWSLRLLVGQWIVLLDLRSRIWHRWHLIECVMCTLMNIGFRVELNGRIELLVDDLKILLGKTLLKFRAREFALAAYKISNRRKKVMFTIFQFQQTFGPLLAAWWFSPTTRCKIVFRGKKRGRHT